MGENQFYVPILKNFNAKECSNYLAIVLILHTSKVILKILQPRLQQHVNQELAEEKIGFQRVRGTRDKIVIFTESGTKQGISRRTFNSASLTTLQPLAV